VALAGWGAARLGDFGSLGIANTATSIRDRGAIRAAASLSDAPLAGAIASAAAVAGSLRPPEPAVEPAAMPVGKAAATDDPNPPETASASAAEASVFETPLPDSRPPSPPETPVQLASIPPADSVQRELAPVVRSVESPDECVMAEVCIEDYLWSLYERTPKIDTEKVTDRIKQTIKKNGKTRTVTKTITNYVVADFTWKDPIAAERAGMSLKDYVIGGLDLGFKFKLYHALRAMDEAGLMPGITSAFRDDYRQSIASGNKAASDSSYHGGSRRGGYGHALAADIVSVKGENRLQRFASSEELWQWIDAHEKELGIGRPYLDRDPPHVGPIDGKEYADKRGRKDVKKASRTDVKKAKSSTSNAPAVAASPISRANRVSLRKGPGKLN
jgi:hypothetical protein